jgi:nicotinate phosphoribosyltransferase
VKETFVRVSEKYGLPYFADLVITASNDINEETILSLNEQVREQRHLSAIFAIKRR